MSFLLVVEAIVLIHFVVAHMYAQQVFLGLFAGVLKTIAMHAYVEVVWNRDLRGAQWLTLVSSVGTCLDQRHDPKMASSGS